MTKPTDETTPSASSGTGVPEVAQAIARVSSLTAMRLVRASAEQHIIADGIGLNHLDYVSEIGGSKSGDPKVPAFEVFVLLKFMYKNGPNDTQPIVTFECNYSLLWSMNSAEAFERLDAEGITAFGANYGLFNVWPYAREYCSNMAARMALPGVVLLPTYRRDLFGDRQWRTTNRESGPNDSL